jgi:hypothetical protein
VLCGLAIGIESSARTGSRIVRQLERPHRVKLVHAGGVMFKFLVSTAGIIFLIGLAVVIGLLMLIF